MSQLTYSLEMPKAVVGLAYDAAGGSKRVVTYKATEEMKFGRGVVKDTSANDLCKLPAGSSDQFLGVLHRDLAEPNGSASVDNAYPDLAAVAVMKQGQIWVQVEEAVTPADAVYCRYAAGTGTELGAFRNDGDTSTAFLVSNARFVTTSETVDGLLVAVLEVNVP